MERFTAGDLGAGEGDRGGDGDAATTSSIGAPARYLDGGYGVGKTHLLAALWHEAPDAEGVPHVRGARRPSSASSGWSRRSHASPRIGCSASTSSSSTTSPTPDDGHVPAGGDRRAARGSPRRRTRCRTGSARAASTPTTSRGRSPRSPRTSKSCASTGPTTGPRRGSRPSRSATLSSTAIGRALAQSDGAVSRRLFD